MIHSSRLGTGYIRSSSTDQHVDGHLPSQQTVSTYDRLTLPYTRLDVNCAERITFSRVIIMPWSENDGLRVVQAVMCGFLVLRRADKKPLKTRPGFTAERRGVQNNSGRVLI